MNYEPNKIDWQIGDLVIHDADAKREDMLMRVVGKLGPFYRTVYVDPKHPYYGRVKRNRNNCLKFSCLVFGNQKEVLHDPARFGIKTAASQIAELKAELEIKTRELETIKLALLGTIKGSLVMPQKPAEIHFRRGEVDKLLDHLVMCCTGKDSRGFQLRIDYCSIGKEWRMQVAKWKWLGYGRNREACATELRDKTMGANL